MRLRMENGEVRDLFRAWRRVTVFDVCFRVSFVIPLVACNKVELLTLIERRPETLGRR